MTRSENTSGADVNKFRIQGLCQTYQVASGAREVLRNVDLDIKKNDTVAIVGPTGVGKSTLVRMLAGFETPTTGSVLVSHDGAWQRITPASEIGYLFQLPNLFPWLTIEKNVAFGARFSRVYKSHSELTEAVDYFIDKVGLNDARGLFPYQVSGGMRARTALARVFSTKPSVLLMDEPFGALDALTRRDMYLMLRELMAQSPEMTNVMITHDVDEAITLCDRIVVMVDTPGRIGAVVRSDLSRRDEPADELETEPDYVSLKAAVLEMLHRNRTH
jgi:taurine transport system ATP-binding protein